MVSRNPFDEGMHLHALQAVQNFGEYNGKRPLAPHARDIKDAFKHAEAAGILEEVRLAIGHDPEGARAAALRLVMFLAPPAAVEFNAASGGLAPWQMRKIDQYMREHLGQPLTLEALAELVPLSISHFCRAFAKTFGLTPHVYIIRLRLELAQDLMLTTREPLSQIALACGLADQAHLSKLFRRYFGETPSGWRRRNLVHA
jgi:transcriptional regulator GlxA family with amidase domain